MRRDNPGNSGEKKVGIPGQVRKIARCVTQGLKKRDCSVSLEEIPGCLKMSIGWDTFKRQISFASKPFKKKVKSDTVLSSPEAAAESDVLVSIILRELGAFDEEAPPMEVFEIRNGKEHKIRTEEVIISVKDTTLKVGLNHLDKENNISLMPVTEISSPDPNTYADS